MSSKIKRFKTKTITVPPSKGFKKEVIDESYNTYPKRLDKRGKSRIVIDSVLKDMNKKIKKKKETGKKDLFDYIGDILKTPYKIRGGKKGTMIKASTGKAVRINNGAALRGTKFKGIF